MDMLLVLNRGGLEVLGKYVAILTVGSIVFLANRLFCDTLLPALTNLMAAGNPKAASEVFSTNLRMLFAIHLTVACAVMFLMEPLVDLMGSNYSNEKALFKLLVILYALGGPGGLGGTLLTAVGKQQLSVWIGAIQLAVYLGAFTLLWPRYGLLGAVIAIGGSSLVCQIALLAAARLKGPLEFPYRRDYFWFVVLGSLAGCVAIGAGTPGFITGVLGCTVPIGAFLLLARYQRRELVGLASCLFPGWKKKVNVIGEQVDG
jgi:O-antigen/teichoic acid export membrane protein